MKVNYLKFRRIVEFVVVFCFFLNGSVWAQPDTLSFLHITDLHVICKQSVYIPEMMEYRKQRQYDQAEGNLRHFLKTIPRETKSDRVIATGDLIDFFEANTADKGMAQIQIKEFSNLLADFKVPVSLALGNHDVFTFNWENNKLKNNQNNAEFSRANWIRNLTCFKNGTYYSELVNVGKTRYRFIFLNDGFYQFLPKDSTDVPYIDKSQLYWLRNQLNKSADDVEIIFMHIPFKKQSELETKRNEFYNLIKEHSSVKAIFCGHFHKNTIEPFLSADSTGFVQVQTGSLAQGRDNWRRICLTENSILISFAGGTVTELKIPLK